MNSLNCRRIKSPLFGSLFKLWVYYTFIFMIMQVFLKFIRIFLIFSEYRLIIYKKAGGDPQISSSFLVYLMTLNGLITVLQVHTVIVFFITQQFLVVVQFRLTSEVVMLQPNHG